VRNLFTQPITVAISNPTLTRPRPIRCSREASWSTENRAFYTCPECNGVLFRIPEAKVDRFRCHTGHGFTTAALLDQLEHTMEANLWEAVKSLQETTALLTETAKKMRAAGNNDSAEELEQKVDQIEERLGTLREIALANGGTA
jgi:two-component system, chemotaxis family, protein-glutamate methylesterase/glutaminase